MEFLVKQYYRRIDGVVYLEGDIVQLREEDLVGICLLQNNGDDLWVELDEVFESLSADAWHGLNNVRNRDWRILGYDRPEEWQPYDHTHSDNVWPGG